MIAPELRAQIRRLFYGEHWRVGTIAAQLGVHHETVESVMGVDRNDNSHWPHLDHEFWPHPWSV